MPRQIALVVALVGSLLVSACKQQSKEEDPPLTVPTAAAAPSPAAVAEPVPDNLPVEPIPPPTPPPPPPPPAAPKPESIKACCSALQKEAESAAAKDKAMYQSAAVSCEAISKLVSAGTTKKAAALTQLRANLRGAKLPGGCD